ncbi:MAG: hypothetical protein H7296_10255 [Bacteroidia bacterium]|nr:hypothetical protein [Bacteroidia bacterium]
MKNKFPFYLAALLIWAMIIMSLFQSCCTGVSCGPCAGNTANVVLVMNNDSGKTGAFKKEELAGTLFLKVDTFLKKTDTLVRLEDSLPDIKSTHYEFNISNIESSDYINPYIYKVQNERIKLNITIEKIKIKGHYNKGCCGCYKCDEIQFTANNVHYMQRELIINKP